ncbi:hypothetical protein BS78_02G133100 [Paspalum vaginatum]|nr:hypothetical protein BS78_02G133100 [Paspalum vaginatum]
MVAAPKDAGKYPVAMLLHGLPPEPFLQTSSQTRCLFWLHHGCAPDPWLYLDKTERGVEPDLSKLALAGHSRGGHTAFALVLGHGKTELKFSALIGLDPVAGITGKCTQISPKILTYEPSSFDIAMPVLVIGTGLGEEKKNILFPPCAPNDVNHKEFYQECRPPCYYFVTKDYGHLDMLDDDAPKLFICWCKDGSNCKDKMRRCVAGIMVAFLKAVLNGEDGDLSVILKYPGLAPTTLAPVEHRLAPGTSRSIINHMNFIN